MSPRPKDWPEHVQITGYWVLSDNMDLYEPPSELAQFLEAGEPPVYLGFGSMPVPDSKVLLHVTIFIIVMWLNSNALSLSLSGAGENVL